jgi:GR25 family glycosyltransferase involved in LPS biosynthesis
LRPAFCVPAFVINLAADTLRREKLSRQFNNLGDFEVHWVTGVDGRTLSDSVCLQLVGNVNWSARKGTIGCFMSHVKAWGIISELSCPFGIVLEDDVLVSGLSSLHNLEIPEDTDIIFVNQRMANGQSGTDTPKVEAILTALVKLDTLKSGPGGDGYLLTPNAAKKLLAACKKDLYFGHVDGRLLQYATSENDLAQLPSGSWISNVIRTHRHPKHAPALGILKGYTLSRPLVTHRGVNSSREAIDGVSP